MSQQVGRTGGDAPVEVDPDVLAESAAPLPDIPSSLPVEVPAEDAVEQALPAGLLAADRVEGGEGEQGLPLDADVADVVEQAREVDLDEDEYR